MDNNVNVIAECGINFDSIETACRMIAYAKTAEAKFVKFQLFNKETIKDSPVKDRLEPLILTESDIETLRNCATENEVGFILTPMYMEAVELAAKHCDYIKIRYADHDNEELINKALDTGKTLLISVPIKPIGAMMYHLRIRYLYCLPSYPPKPEDFDIDLASTCQGVSLHYPHTLFDLAYAVDRCYEECFIEKHVEPDMIPGWANDGLTINFKPIDHAVSITFEQLRIFTEQLKLIEQMRRKPKI
uniref:Putative N-acetylneuraminate synthase n=1 Tax=viral metagenome TaxID=1070528 RepID=A0A6M3J4T4_9ZZZZ